MKPSVWQVIDLTEDSDLSDRKIAKKKSDNGYTNSNRNHQNDVTKNVNPESSWKQSISSSLPRNQFLHDSKASLQPRQAESADENHEGRDVATHRRDSDGSDAESDSLEDFQLPSKQKRIVSSDLQSRIGAGDQVIRCHNKN